MDKEILKQLCEEKRKFGELKAIYSAMPDGSKVEMTKEDALATCDLVLTMVNACLIDE